MSSQIRFSQGVNQGRQTVSELNTHSQRIVVIVGTNDNLHGKLTRKSEQVTFTTLGLPFVSTQELNGQTVQVQPFKSKAPELSRKINRMDMESKSK